MSDLDQSIGLPGFALLAAATAVAGAVNSVAGGGTILTFPVLAAILPADPGRLVTANATSTIGLWPGSVVAAWAYRGAREGQPAWARWLLLPSVIGAILGTVLLLWLPPQWFDAAVPWLILSAATLFAIQPQVTRFVARRGSDAPESGAAAGPSPARLAMACGLQLLVSTYGGYFGAGIGILMLAMLGLLGLGDIHRLNGVKNVLGSAINGVGAVMFAVCSAAGVHEVSWPCVAVMAVAASAGGLAGAVVARRLPAPLVRRAVAIIGFALAGYYLLRPSA